MSLTIGSQTTHSLSNQLTNDSSVMASVAPLLASSIQQTQEAREKTEQAERNAQAALQKTLGSLVERIAQLEKEVIFEREQRKKDQEMSQAKMQAQKQLFEAQLQTHKDQTTQYLQELQEKFLDHVHKENDEKPVFVTKTNVPNRPNTHFMGKRLNPYLDERGVQTAAPTHVEKTYTEISERKEFYDERGGKCLIQ